MTSQQFKDLIKYTLQANGCIIQNSYVPCGANAFNVNRVIIPMSSPDTYMLMSPFKNYYTIININCSDEEFKSKIFDFRDEIKKSFLDAFENDVLPINLTITLEEFFKSIARLFNKLDARIEFDRLIYRGESHSFNHESIYKIIKALLK